MRPSIPILPSAFCSAMSRTLQVLSSTTSASVSFAAAFVAAIEQRVRDLLRVALVHLAAVGFDEKFRHRGAKLLHGARRRATAGDHVLIS